MTLEQAAYLAEIVGVLVIVVTLIYLSLQVRQGAELLRSESRQAQISNDLISVSQFVEHPDLARIFTATETPSFEEKAKLLFWMVGQMRAREHEWLQYQSGALDEASWLGFREVIYFVLGTERARALWDICSPNFNSDFVAMVGSMIKDVPHIDFWKKLDAIS